MTEPVSPAHGIERFSNEPLTAACGTESVKKMVFEYCFIIIFVCFSLAFAVCFIIEMISCTLLFDSNS